MASLFQKIKHAIHPKTNDIEDEQARSIGNYFKNLQTHTEILSKQSRKMKQKIKIDVKISPEKAKELAKETFKKPQSFTATLKNVLTDLENIANELGMYGTKKALKAAINSFEKTKNDQQDLLKFNLSKFSKTFEPNSEIKLDETEVSKVSPSKNLNKESVDYINNFSKKLQENTVILTLNDLNSFINNYNQLFKNFEGIGNFEKISIIKNLDKNTFKFSDKLKQHSTFFNNKISNQIPQELADNLYSVFSKLINRTNIIITKPDSQKRKYVHFSDSNKETAFRNYISQNNYYNKDDEKNDMNDKKVNLISWFYTNQQTDKDIDEYLKTECTGNVIIKYE